MFRESFLRQGGAVYTSSGDSWTTFSQGGASCRLFTAVYSGSGVSRGVPDQGAVFRYQGGAVWSSLFSYLVLEIVVASVLVLHGGYMFVRRPEGAGWYDLVLLRNNIEEGADSEEELWVTGSESESDTDESDTEDGQDNC